MGREWQYVGDAEDLPWGGVIGFDGVGRAIELDSADGRVYGSSLDCEIPNHASTSFIFEISESGVWHTWERMYDETDDDLLADLEAEYTADRGSDPHKVAGVDPIFTPVSIRGSDDRSTITPSRLVSGGLDDDAYTAIRTVRTPVGGGLVAQGTGTMLQARKGITAAHMFYDSDGLIAAG